MKRHAGRIFKIDVHPAEEEELKLLEARRPGVKAKSITSRIKEVVLDSNRMNTLRLVRGIFLERSTIDY